MRIDALLEQTAPFLKPSWRELKMTKIAIPGSYVWRSLGRNWQKCERQKAKMMKKSDVLHRLLLRWGVSCSVTFSRGGVWSISCFQVTFHIPVTMAAELAWALFWCEASLEAEVGRHLCDVTWEGALDGTINRPLQTGRGKVTLPLVYMSTRSCCYMEKCSEVKWRDCACDCGGRWCWWQMNRRFGEQ